MTLPSSTTSTAGSVTLEPTSPASVSTVRTSSTDAFSCLPPQRTIAYTEELSLCLCGPNALSRQERTTGTKRGSPALHRTLEPSLGSVLCAGTSGYQTPAAADASDAACPSVLTAASGGPGSLVAARRLRRPPNDWPAAPFPAASAAASWSAP